MLLHDSVAGGGGGVVLNGNNTSNSLLPRQIVCVHGGKVDINFCLILSSLLTTQLFPLSEYSSFFKSNTKLQFTEQIQEPEPRVPEGQRHNKLSEAHQLNERKCVYHKAPK